MTQTGLHKDAQEQPEVEVFTQGVEYRRQKLLDFVGSRQAQSGVIWGERAAGALICTTGGRHGRMAGYVDEPLADGSWYYFGQGVQGSQTLRNSANARLAHLNATVFLFISREPSAAEIAKASSYGKLYRHVGQFRVAAVEQYRPSSGVRKQDTLLRFLLVPTDLQPAASDDDINELDGPLIELRNRLCDEESAPQNGSVLGRYWLRCRIIRRYALLRSGGFCEGCDLRAPLSSHG